MVRIKHILVPTDLSVSSQAAFPYATSLALQHKSDITLVYVMEPVPILAIHALDLPTQLYEKRIFAAAEKSLHRIAGKLGKKTIVNTVVRRGNVADQILAVARAKKVDFIVMSTHGRSGVGHVLLGSVAEKIVRRAACPVLAVKPTK